MILTCPSCTTRYQVDDARFAPPGRNVRCAKCGHVWFQEAAEPAMVPEPEIEPVIVVPPPPVADIPAEDVRRAPPPMFSPVADRLAPLEDPRRGLPIRGLGQALGWLVLAALAAVIVAAFIIFRTPIAALWPQSASFYAAVGMPVNVRGLVFSDVAYKLTTEDGQPVLSLTGNLQNVTSREIPVPMLRVDLNDAQKRSIYNWTFDTGATTLRPGQSVQFVTRLSNPPPDTHDLQLHLADASASPAEPAATAKAESKPK